MIKPHFVGAFSLGKANMAEKKAKPKKKEAPEMYEGYDIRWLKSEPSHPDYHLVAEYEKKFGEIK